MSQPRWIEVNLSTVLVPDNGWHRDDEATAMKLANSLTRHGQLQPLLVRGIPEDDSMVTLVRGHKMLAAMQALGWQKAMAVHVGDITPVQALLLALHLELKFKVNWVAIADAVCTLVNDGGMTLAELASTTPFDEERLRHFVTLRNYDWAKFGEDTSQSKLDWDALEEVLPPPLAVVHTAPPSVHIEPPIIPVPVVERLVDAAATAIDRTRPDTTQEQVVDAMREALEDITEPAAPEPAPAAPAAAPPQAAAPAAATAGEAAAQPAPAAKAKRAKAAKEPKPPGPQLGLF